MRKLMFAALSSVANALVNPDACRNLVAGARERLRQRIAAEAEKK